MNKQEVIKTIYGHLSETEDECSKGTFDQGYDQGCEFCIALIEQLDEPKKVVVPKFVSDWISCSQLFEFGVFEALRADKPLVFKGKSHMNKCKSWIISKSNQELFVRAWLDGYEVEKEPLYYVKLPEIGYMRFGKKYFYSTDKEDAKRYTENQIKAIDERYWLYFTKKVEDE